MITSAAHRRLRSARSDRVSRSAASGLGLLHVHVVVGTRVGPHLGVAERGLRDGDRLAAQGGGHQQHRHPDLRVQLGGVESQHRPQDRPVVVAAEPGPHPAVLELDQVRQGAGQALVGPVRMPLADALRQVAVAQAVEGRRRHRCPRLLLVGETVGQVQPAAVDAGHPGHQVAAAGRQRQHDVAAPGLADHHRRASEPPGSLLGLDQRCEVVGAGQGVVAGRRRPGTAVAALVDRDGEVPGGRQLTGDAVPGAAVRREPVHQQERGTGGSAGRLGAADGQAQPLGGAGSRGQDDVGVCGHSLRLRRPTDSPARPTARPPDSPARRARTGGGRWGQWPRMPRAEDAARPKTPPRTTHPSVT